MNGVQANSLLPSAQSHGLCPADQGGNHSGAIGCRSAHPSAAPWRFWRSSPGLHEILLKRVMADSTTASFAALPTTPSMFSMMSRQRLSQIENSGFIVADGDRTALES